MEIKYYKCKNGLIVNTSTSAHDRERALFNGKKLEPTHSSSWFFLKGESNLKSVKKQTSIKFNYYFELKEDFFEAAKLYNLAKKYTSKEVGYSGYNYNEVEQFSDKKFEKYRNFYNKKREELPPSYKEVEFKVTSLGEIEYKLEGKPEDYKVSLTEKKFNSFQDTIIEKELSTICTYSELERILIPEFLLYKRPCKLTSQQVYKIVRAYIKDNIDIKYAKIDTDYDFCLTVKKKINIKPYIGKREILTKRFKSYSPPRFKNFEVANRDVTILEIAPEFRKGYEVVDEIHGKTLEDLANNVKRYLNDLMAVINEPLHECENCKGRGVIIKEIRKS